MGRGGRAVLLALALPVGLAYAKVSAAYYCSFDDFGEVHRAAFEDAREPRRIFTTSHFGSYKYRPLYRLATYLTYHLGGGRAEMFRVRNLIFHVTAVWLLYLIGRQIHLSRRACLLGSLLFGLHPLVNQSVTLASASYTMAHAAFLAALALFFVSLRAGSAWWAWLGGSLLTGWLALLVYDSSIMVFGLMGAYLGLSWLAQSEPPASRRIVIVFALVTLALLAANALLRTLFVPHLLGEVKPDWPSPGVVLRNIAIYVGALLLPIDPVLAQEWWGTPLPSEIRLTGFALAVAGLLSLVGVAGLVWALVRRARYGRLESGANGRLAVGFLLLAIAAPLAPVLLVTSHASESYVYLSVAFYALLLGYALERITVRAAPRRHALLYALFGGFLVSLACAGTWVRNERIIRCGTTAERILTGVPLDRLREGDWTLLFSHPPGRLAGRRYGHFNFRGLDTIDDSVGRDYTISAALQVLSGSDRVRGEIVSPEELSQRCSAPPSDHRLCFWVGDDGALEEFGASSPGAFHLE